jgi:hypothetical protein
MLSFLIGKWQPLRSTLRNVLLEQPVRLESLTLSDAARAVVKQVEAKKHIAIRCVFSPEDLANRQPISIVTLDGNALYSLNALEYSYDCRYELAGDHIILFVAETPEAPPK